MVVFLGLCSVAGDLNGFERKLEPFPPGTYEEYDITENGTVKLVRSERYHQVGDRPHFTTFVPWQGEFWRPLAAILVDQKF